MAGRARLRLTVSNWLEWSKRRVTADPLLPLRGVHHADYLKKLEGALAGAAEALPGHADYIAQNCTAV